MRFKLTEDKNLYSGIFWIVYQDDIYSNKDYCFQIPVNSSGNVVGDTDYELNAKSGDTYNHKEFWKNLPPKMTHNKSFDYYPRGRVQIANGKATIYLNPNINTEEVKQFLIKEFNLNSFNGIKKVVVNSDGSEHYKCYLDR